MKIKIIILFILSVVMLSSCASDRTVMKYGEAELSERIYNYWLHQYKTYFLASSDSISDTKEYWNSKVVDGTDMTMDEYFTELADINIKKNIVCMKLFDEYGLTVPDETYAQIDQEIQDYIDSYGSKNEFNKMLGTYGINDKLYREIYVIQEKIAILFEHVFAADGGRVLTNEEIEDYYLNNYLRIKYITINLYDEADDGSFVALEEVEKSRRINQAKDIYNDIVNNGADFERNFTLYSYDKLDGYSNGIYISQSNAGTHDVIDAGLKLGIGEYAYVEIDYAAYIVTRLELEEKAYSSDKTDQMQFTDLYTKTAESVFQSMLLEYIDEVEIAENVKKNYSVGKADF